MKKQILFLSMLVLALVFTGCSDDDPIIEPVIPQEVITTVVVTLSATDGTEYVMRWEDSDYAVGDIVAGYSGDVSIPEGAYTGDIQLYNNTLSPDDEEYTVTNEIIEEGSQGSLAHQFFFTSLGDLVLDSVAYLDLDDPGLDAEGNEIAHPCGENKPIGQQFSMVAVSGMGELGVLLIHEPEKCEDGVSDGIWNQVGDDDVDLQFPLTINTN